MKALCKFHRAVDVASGQENHGGIEAAKHLSGSGSLVQPKALAVVDVDGDACKDGREAELQNEPRQLYFGANVNDGRVCHGQ